MKPFCTVIDWGTTSLRAWLLSGAGDVLAQSRGEDGISNVETGGYESVLNRHLSVLDVQEDLPVLISGMAGARQGWHEAAYLDAPASFGDIARAAVRVPGPSRDIRILPGIAQRHAHAPDVMRGEETQLLGLNRDNALVCIPGTHSKWVHVQAGQVATFATHMTGELFALLSQQSILRFAMGDDVQANAGFEAGVGAMLRPGAAIGQTLFSVRARGLVADDPGDGAAYLSGLLIGAEVAAARDAYGTGQPVTLLASGAMAELYLNALQSAGFAAHSADVEEASRNGLLRAATELWGPDA